MKANFKFWTEKINIWNIFLKRLSWGLSGEIIAWIFITYISTLLALIIVTIFLKKQKKSREESYKEMFISFDKFK